MNLRHFEAFVVLAEELHFGRAASRLGITQSALSQLVGRLENDLGTQLVVRTSREVGLTEAGEIFLAPAQQALVEADRARSLVDDYKAGKVGRLTVGSLGAGLNGPLTDVIDLFRARSPHGLIELRHYPDSASQERGLIAGTLDVAVIRRVVNDRALEARELLRETFVAFVPRGHRLEGRDLVSLAELADEAFVLWPRELGSSYYDLVVDACRARGFEPRIEGFGTSLEAQLTLVAAGVGVSVQSVANQAIAREGTVTVPVEPADLRASLWVAYPRWNRSATARLFVEAIDEYLTGHPDGSG